MTDMNIILDRLTAEIQQHTELRTVMRNMERDLEREAAARRAAEARLQQLEMERTELQRSIGMYQERVTGLQLRLTAGADERATEMVKQMLTAIVSGVPAVDWRGWRGRLIRALHAAGVGIDMEDAAKLVDSVIEWYALPGDAVVLRDIEVQIARKREPSSSMEA